MHIYNHSIWNKKKKKQIHCWKIYLNLVSFSSNLLISLFKLNIQKKESKSKKLKYTLFFFNFFNY